MILTSIERLIPQQYYIVVVNWNKDSNVFIDNEYILFGKFIDWILGKGEHIHLTRVLKYLYDPRE